MKTNLLSSLFFLVISAAFAQEKHTISGYISDINKGESIVGANIYCKDLSVGVTSNTYGFYSLTLPEGTYDITYSFIGYQNEKSAFQLNRSVKYDIEFALSSVNIQEVVVNADISIVEKTQTSMIEVPIEQRKTIPVKTISNKKPTQKWVFCF